MKAPLPLNEKARLEALRRYQILDTEAEEAYDNITRLANHLCYTPVSMITMVDEDRQWYKSKMGVEMQQTPRDISFCAHAILDENMTVVPDMRQDERFSDNPFVTSGPQVRFYAGVPLITPDGHALGTLCVLDREPRILSPQQKDMLTALGRHVVFQMEMRRLVAGQALVLNSLNEAQQASKDANKADEVAQTGLLYVAACENATQYIFETVPDKAYFSADTALARFYGHDAFEELFASLSDI